MLNGDFVGNLHTLRLAVLNGQTTLPQNYRTINGVILEDVDRVLGIANLWYQYMPGHRQAVALNANMEILRDLGDGHATIYEMPVAGTLSLQYSGTPDMPVTIYGVDSDRMPLVLTIPDNTAGVANPFYHIDRIHKETTDRSLKVLHTAADTTETTLAVMAPTTEETYYRRYAIDTLASTAAATILCLAKLRHVDFTSDQDILPFTNIGALEAMMDSLQYRAENDINLADRYEADSVDILNKELGDVNASSSFPVIRFVYPGGTTPRLVSRY